MKNDERRKSEGEGRMTEGRKDGGTEGLRDGETEGRRDGVKVSALTERMQ